ncbi:MAG: MFS transporter [Verrucomicrobiae bacterium]|nr:MFS transporter [Verrucomicrobiae bacterium]
MTQTKSQPVAKREIVGWAFFDFANSSFTTIMVTTIFPIYFTSVLSAERTDGSRLWGIAGGLSNLIVVIISPFLGALADSLGAKKKFLFATYLGCVIATGAIGLLSTGSAYLAISLFIFANICFSLGENFCAGFLPEISTPETAGRISAYGWSLGYFGGLLSLLLAYFLPAQGAILATAGFFLLSGTPTFLFLKERKLPTPLPFTNPLQLAFGPILNTFYHLKHFRTLALFFVSFFFFNAGVITVIYFSSLFASIELHMTPASLTTLFLLLQISAAGGAIGFGFAQDKIGSRLALSLSLVLWIGVVLGCYFTRSIITFYVLAALAGLALGATQSCARAMVSILTPPEKAGEFFGFWGLFGKLSAVVALPLFGEIAQRFGARAALLITLGCFAIGLILLACIKSIAPQSVTTKS